jgi:N-acetylneuraminate synthase
MEIGPSPFIIAELSGNHGGKLTTALNMIAAAKECGCDAVKIQTYEPEDLCDPANNELYEKCKIPRDWFPQLFEHAKNCGIPLFSSIFAPWAVEFLEQFGCPAYKIASPESTRLVDYGSIIIAISRCRTRKPLIASTGRKDRNFIRSLSPDYLLYCVAGYPATVTDDDISYCAEHHFSGFSDHSSDIKTPLAMIAAGARIIEKHFKLNDDCIDAAFSLNPQQMQLLCDLAHA